MTASEFAFLALGLALGAVSGAALLEVLRSRPPSPREVRVTMTPDSVPRRRPVTLAEDAFVMPGPEPALAGPADRRSTTRQTPATADSRTDVRSRILQPSRDGQGRLAPLPALRKPDPAAAIAIQVHRETDWMLAELRAAAAETAAEAIIDQGLTAEAVIARSQRSGVATADPLPQTALTDSRATGSNRRLSTAAAADDRPVARAARKTAPDGGGAGSTAAVPDSADPCAELGRVADERCNLATRSREQAEGAAEALRAAQQGYDEHVGRADQAALAADPRTVRIAKESAQRAFRDARSAAGSRELVEAAARDWLSEINRINLAARDAQSIIQREREAANELVADIERLTVEADTAQKAAASADEGCVAARQAVTDCQATAEADRAAAAAAAAVPQPPPGAPSEGFGSSTFSLPDDEKELELAFDATGVGEPAILRLLRGDRAELGRIVRDLAGDDPAERRRWQLAIAGLIDAIVARSIEASALTFPIEHPFWGAFTLPQNRDIVGALSSLGFRFDGLGGWTDERHPSQRDLSLAIGYAGLDPMRIRRWPSESETATLFQEVAVAADEYLAEAAGGLTLGELIDVLGHRADPLADLWNDWPRVRPLLLAGG